MYYAIKLGQYHLKELSTGLATFLNIIIEKSNGL